MTASPAEKRPRKPKARKLYSIYERVHTPPGLKMENIAVLDGGRPLMSPRWERRFPSLTETPRLVIDRSLGRPPVDWELFHDFWLVSDRMKNVLESVDRDGVAFLECETRSTGRKAAPVYWLCDVVRILEAVDEEKSRFEVLDEGKQSRRYNGMALSSFVYREEAIGSAHIFRLRFMKSRIICDQIMKDACRAADVRGIGFGDASK